VARLGFTILGALAAAAALALGAAAPASAGDGSLLGCGDTASHPFLRWLDPLPYTLAPDGGFEDGGAGWSFSGGARVVSGNSSFNLSGPGARSLFLPEGSSATSPPMCVGLLLPIVRYVASGGELLATLRTEVVYRDLFGARRSIELLPGALPSSSWQPTLPLAQLGGLVNALTLNGLTTDVQFRFTPRGLFGGGSWRVDEIYVDPWKDWG
jgi:hypothetical protein